MTAFAAVRSRPLGGIAAAAVEWTTSRGARAVRGSVFDRLPDEVCRDTVLLADGNVGTGGDPPALLARLREVVRPGGLLIIETEQTDVDEVGN